MKAPIHSIAMTLLPMVRSSNRLFALMTLALISLNPAQAERADREKPINLEADTVTVDDINQTSVYEGNVILTQGTILLRANKLVVKQDAEGFQHGTAYGNPASFRQKREGLDEYVEGYGLRIEYDGRKDFVEFFDQARLKRNQDEVRGSYISYDSATEFMKVLGGGREAASPSNPQGRVRAVIQPKPKTPPPPAAPLSLQPAPAISAPRAP